MAWPRAPLSKTTGFITARPATRTATERPASGRRTAPALVIDHNRIDEPGMLSPPSSNFEGVFFSAVSNSRFDFNDVSVVGANLAGSLLLELTEHLEQAFEVQKQHFLQAPVAVTSVGLVKVSPRISSPWSMRAARAASWRISTTTSARTRTIRLPSAPAVALALPNWTCGAAQDVHSIAAPSCSGSTPAAGVEDFHPMSAAGRWTSWRVR